VDAPVVDSIFVERVRAIAERGAAEALKSFRNAVPVDNKAGPEGFDPVTAADRAAEAAIRRAVEAEFPDHGILGEEQAEKKTPSPWRWVIDPIDGTRGFICGTPTWTTLVGVEHDQRPVVGIIVQPYIGETWVGQPGRTDLFFAGRSAPLETSGEVRLDHARLATTDPRPRPHGPFVEHDADVFDAVAQRTRVSRFGHDAYAYALLASGHLDLVIESGLQRYDIAALVPVVEGAGGVLTDWEGEPGIREDGANPHGRVIAAASPQLHHDALSAIRHALATRVSRERPR